MKSPSSSPPARKVVDQEAPVLLEDAFARYQGELLGTMYYLVGNREDARDAVQEVFLKCWRHIDKVPALDNLKAWIFRIAWNTGRDFRKTAWKRRRRPLAGEDTMASDDSATAAAVMDRNEQLDRVRRALSNLRPEEKEVFLLRQNGELTYEQIAREIGIPAGTVKTRMRLALTKLRAALVEAGEG